MKNSFVLFTKWQKQISKLSREQKGDLLEAIFNSQAGVDLPEMDAVTEMLFDIISDTIDENNKKYEETIEKRKEAGKKGGRPKKDKSEEQEEDEDDEEEEKAKKAKGFLEKQKKQKVFEKANGFSEKQKNPVYDNVSDNVSDTDNDTESDNDTEPHIVSGKDTVNYQKIVDLYNDTCVSLPRVTKITNGRRKAIKARMNTYGYDGIAECFEKAAVSDFLKGKNGRNWNADFDWLMKDSNMVKVLEGNYDNKSSPSKIWEVGDGRSAPFESSEEQGYNIFEEWRKA